MIPKAVIFDLDGTLIDSERGTYRIYEEVTKKYGIPFDESHYMQGIGVFDGTQIILRKLCSDEKTIQALLKDKEAIKSERDRLGIGLKDGVQEILDFLLLRKIPAAVATSTPRDRALLKMIPYALEKKVQLVVGGDQVKRIKPDPEIYVKAAMDLNFAPADCFAVEDSPIGLRAARDAGMKVVHIPDMIPSDEETRALSDYEFKNLHEFKEFLSK